jgi:hypothetical protein
VQYEDIFISVTIEGVNSDEDMRHHTHSSCGKLVHNFCPVGLSVKSGLRLFDGKAYGIDMERVLLRVPVDGLLKVIHLSCITV